MRGRAVVDITIDPIAARADRRRAVLRIGVPVFGVVLMIAAILVIAVYANSANRRGALALSDDVLTALDARIAEQVTQYFGTPARALAIGEDLAGVEPPGELRRSSVEKFFISALRQIPQVADFIFADPEGNFLMVRRNEKGGADTKLVRNSPGPRMVVWTRRNAAGEVTGHDEDPSDTFDPRTRPYYAGALSATGMFWTDVYKFYTDGEPGIAAATRYQAAEGRNLVIGVDITLASLSNFLSGLKIGESGRAMIIAGDGRIIAYPQAERVVTHNDAGPVTARINEIGDPAAAGAYDHFRVNGPGSVTITINGERYLATLTPLEGVGHNWSIMIVLPEKDFIGFVTRNNRTGLVMSLAIVAIAVLFAALLVRQGLRGDRAARLVRERARAMARQSEALDLLTDEADLFEPSQAERPQALTETAAEITGARRANLWHLLPDRKVLRCTDSFDRDTSRHSGGFELHRDELPQFFDHVAAGTTIDVADAAHDPRTAEAYRVLMAPLGSRSLSVVPMRRRGHVVGAICLEDASDIAGTRQFLRVLASMAALRATEATGEEGAKPRGLDIQIGSHPAEPVAVRSFSSDLTLRGLDKAALGEAFYPEVAVLIMRVDEPISAANGGISPPELIDSIVCAMQEIAAEQDIPYLKLVGYDIVGAAGFSPGDPTGAMRIANIAVAGRDRLAALFEAGGLEPEFRLGIDCGIAIGRPIGSNPRFFNLWGEAVRTAQIMAASALPGGIQTSESAYLRLRHSFLLRPRGTFYLPSVGTAQTFVLAGRL